MSKFKIMFIAATMSASVLAAPVLASAATAPAPQAKSDNGGMMAGGKMSGNGMTSNDMTGKGMAGGGMAGMMGMMAMMNACTRVMNKMADNMGHGTMGAHPGSMMGKAAPKKS
ncbi:hypothetical protein [Acidiphilium multivorum]|uniref:hypothetical protein n=1 Tax=Acidiphilium multivorum TaxID=62140 RepID=UPI001B8D432A|nr:hypothetical protein [Acidiphilium multivorum]MBS3025046.1 hypothetical protein [Acidiphilium multivorum]MBS3025047.1 hypothetical protein [Acidiphilium multivorum]